MVPAKQDDDVAFAALDTQFAIVQRALKKDSGRHGYYELRLMLRVCYCGTVALRYQRQEVVEKTLSMVKDFEEALKTTSSDSEGLPSLLGEFISWRETVIVRKREMILDYANEVAARLVTLKDVDTFIAKAWGVHLRPFESSDDEDAK